MTAVAGCDEILERLRRGELPSAARMAAAGGALPLPPADLLRLQAYLALHDEEDEVRQAATATLREADVALTLPLVESPDLAREVAEFFAQLPDTAAPILESLARNPACPDEAIRSFAGRAGREVIGALLTNQMRLIRSPAVLEALEGNPGLTHGQRDQLQELRRHFLEVPPEAEPLSPDVAAEMGQAILAAEAEEARREAQEDAEEPTEPATASEEPEELEEADGEETDENVPAFRRILLMSPAEKVKLAFCGNAEERLLLVRDTNRMVARAVLKSPRLTDKEVERFVQMRNLDEDVVRAISANREWTKSYAVVWGLVRNPKTSPQAALKLIDRVNTRDLKLLTTDRNIQELVRQTARKRFVARTGGGQKGRR